MPFRDTSSLPTPEVPSVPVTPITTGDEAYQLLVPSGDGAVKLAVGAVESKRMFLVVVAVFPALSTARTCTTNSPSEEIVREGVQVVPSRETPWLDRPEVASDEFAVTVTGEIYHPFAPSGDARDASGMGAVRSTKMVTGAAVVVIPALLLVRKTIVWVPSVPALIDEPFCQEPPST